MTVDQVRQLVPDLPVFVRESLSGNGIYTQFPLSNAPIVPDSVSVIRDGNTLASGTDYSVNAATGVVTFTEIPEPADIILLDYLTTLLSDDQINTFLTLRGSVILAAADACETIGNNQVLRLKVITLYDLRTDGAAVGRELRLRASAMRESVAQADSVAFDIAEQAVSVFAARQILWNDLLRGSA